jgi:ABC-type transport system involved in multi-copper enzyme maturation permease subunit
MLRALIVRSVAHTRGVLIGVAALLAAFQVALVFQAASFDEQQAFDVLARMVPGFVQRWMGDTMFTLASFSGVIAFGYFHPVVVLVVSMATAFLASDPAADVEAGYMDLLLARPVARHWIVTRSAVLMVLCPTVLVVLMMISTWTTMALVAPGSASGPSLPTILTLSAHLVAVAWCFGALSLALATAARRRGSAFAPAAIAAVALYLVNVLAASWAPARAADILSPFHYYQGSRILAGLADTSRDLLVLGSAGAVLVALSYWRFATRDL